jgi:fatty acid desaturase
MHKHNRHHRAPNQEGRDPDVAPGAFAFTPNVAAGRPAWLDVITRRQGYLFFPSLLLEGANLHVAGVRSLVERRDLPHRRLEGGLIALRFAGYAALLLTAMSPLRAAVFAAVQLAVFGFFLGAAFAPNHKGMPIVPPDLKLDFIRRQVLMSRNIRGGWLVDLAMGGLNYQVEHHLFPSMPRDNLRLARPLVRSFCDELQVPYTETTLGRSYGIVIRYLNTVGLRDRDPFACPFIGTYRR